MSPASEGRSPLLDDPRASSARPCEAMADVQVLRLVEQGVILAREFITHELNFSECQRGFELLASREAFKVGLTF